MSRRGNTAPAISLFSFQDIITAVTGVMILVTLLLALELVKRKEGSPAHQTEVVSEQLDEAIQSTKQIELLIAANDERIHDLREQVANNQEGLKEIASLDPEKLRDQLAQLQGQDRDLQMKIARTTGQVAEVEDRIKKRPPGDTDPAKLEIIRTAIAVTVRKLEQLKNSNRVVYDVKSDVSKKVWIVEISGSVIRAATAGKASTPENFSSAEEFLSWAGRRNAATEWFFLVVKPSGIGAYNQIYKALSSTPFDRGTGVLSEDKIAIDSKLGAGI